MTARLTVCDTTLRDGSHAMLHRFTPAQVRGVAGRLGASGVPVVEISHGDGLGGSSLTYGQSLFDELELIEAAIPALAPAALAVLLLPGIGVKEDLVAARELGAAVARVATHCTEADIAESHLGFARELGMRPVGFLMMAHMNSPHGLSDQARVMAEAGAEVVYVTDSAGALTPADVRARVEALREALAPDVAVGFHGHNNLGLAVGNTIAAVESGATWIDGCLCGIGAGAGNAPTELLVAACERAGFDTGADVIDLLDVAEEIVRPLLPRPMVADRAAATLGYAGVYSSFLLHAERAASRFGVPSHEILLEVGRRGAVGGQEDLIVSVAAELGSNGDGRAPMNEGS